MWHMIKFWQTGSCTVHVRLVNKHPYTLGALLPKIAGMNEWMNERDIRIYRSRITVINQEIWNRFLLSCTVFEYTYPVTISKSLKFGNSSNVEIFTQFQHYYYLKNSRFLTSKISMCVCVCVCVRAVKALIAFQPIRFALTGHSLTMVFLIVEICSQSKIFLWADRLSYPASLWITHLINTGHA